MNATQAAAPEHAAHLPVDTREALEKRLKRIEGQVRGLMRMVEEERYCADTLAQIASTREALRGVGKILLRNHLTHCTADAIRSGDAADADRVVDELVALWGR